MTDNNPWKNARPRSASSERGSSFSKKETKPKRQLSAQQGSDSEYASSNQDASTQRTSNPYNKRESLSKREGTSKREYSPKREGAYKREEAPKNERFSKREKPRFSQTSEFSDTELSSDDLSSESISEFSQSQAPIVNRNELRLYGLNAIRAVFAKRPESIRKLYLAEAKIPVLQPLLAWCVKNRIGYRVVENADLSKLAASAHHEGVVADVLRSEPLSLSMYLSRLAADQPAVLLWLDGVANPHNFGAILRAAAHFGVDAILLPKNKGLNLSGAAARVAEGGAEAISLVHVSSMQEDIDALHQADFSLAATVVRGGNNVFTTELPPRLVYVMGAEADGMSSDLIEQCDWECSIPGTGKVESLNVAAATAVFLAQWKSQHT